MTKLLGQVLHTLPLAPLRTTRRFVAHPVATQEALLRDLLSRAADTAWGRRYGFAELAKATDVVDAYQTQVPLHQYDDIRGDVEQIRKGAADVYWPGRFQYFAVSSGTASAGKIIPVSREMLVKNRAFSLGTALHYLAESADPRFWMGRFLSLPGRIEEDPAHPGTQIGEVSGLQSLFAPAFVKHLYQAIPNETLFMPNWEEKLDAIVARTLMMDIRAIAMVPTWALVLFRKLIAAHNARGGRHVRTVGEIWPNLQVFFSGGVALSSYRALLEEQIGLPRLHFIESYGASEGFFSFQNGLDDADMLLHLDNGVFFEFVRLSDLGQDNPRRYTVADAEPDVRYALYVTTCSGLWSYGVGDVVRFTSTAPHKIVVAGRTSEMIDKYGEAVFGEEARTALQQACDLMGVHVLDYHIAPQPPQDEGLPTHQWFIEFETPPDNLEAFSNAIDAYLQGVNRHYQIRREAQAFDRPEIVPVPRQTFYRWLHRSRKQVSAQTKVPRMSEDRTVADGLLALTGHPP